MSLMSFILHENRSKLLLSVWTNLNHLPRPNIITYFNFLHRPQQMLFFFRWVHFYELAFFSLVFWPNRLPIFSWKFLLFLLMQCCLAIYWVLCGVCMCSLCDCACVFYFSYKVLVTPINSLQREKPTHVSRLVLCVHVHQRMDYHIQFLIKIFKHWHSSLDSLFWKSHYLGIHFGWFLPWKEVVWDLIFVSFSLANLGNLFHFNI